MQRSGPRKPESDHRHRITFPPVSMQERRLFQRPGLELAYDRASWEDADSRYYMQIGAHKAAGSGQQRPRVLTDMTRGMDRSSKCRIRTMYGQDAGVRSTSKARQSVLSNRSPSRLLSGSSALQPVRVCLPTNGISMIRQIFLLRAEREARNEVLS